MFLRSMLFAILLASATSPPSVEPVFELSSDLLVGNKGEEEIEVGTTPQCGTVWAFERAEIKILRNRFGGAQFIGLPQAGCIECEPIRVRWYHEPTGHLSFEVRVVRKPVTGRCPPAGATLEPVDEPPHRVSEHP